MSKQRRAEAAGGGSLAIARSVQLLNERAHILGLQLQQAALSTRIAEAVRSYGLPTPQEQLHELLRRGVIHSDLAAAREEVTALKALLERVQSGRLASTSGSASSAAASAASTGSGSSRAGGSRQAGGAAGGGTAAARAAGSKQFAALAADHVRHWLEQAQEAVLLLEDLSSPGSIDEWPLQPPELPPPRPPGGPPVAHFIQRIPPELAANMELPAATYDEPTTAPPPPPATGRQQQQQPSPQHPGSAAELAAGADGCMCSSGGGGGGGGVLWSAAPLLRDPAAGVTYRVALHESAELMWPSLAHGDLVLLLPGRYNWPEGTVMLRAAVRVLGLGRQSGDVVIHNNEEDDVFVECSAGPQAGAAASPGCCPAEAGGVVLENLTLLQLGGYEGALRVLRGRTTLVDVVVQFAMGGLQVEPGAQLVMRNSRVAGGATAGVQVAAGGVLEMVAGCEVTRTGGGDDVVPKDLGGVEVMVPLADYPRLTPPSPRALIHAHADLLAPPGGKTQGQGGATTSDPPPPPPLDRLGAHLGSLQPPATVVVGPGCTVQNTRGFAVSLVKKRTLVAYHELLHSGGGGGGQNHSAAGAGGGGCGLAASLEGARVLVARGAALGPNNSRGAVGVVETEYHQLDGDAVNRRTASRHFHAVQLAARQLQEGFSSPGVDWTAHRIRLEGNPARPGRRATKIEVAAAAAAAAAPAAAGPSAGGGGGAGSDGRSGGGGGGSRRQHPGVVVGCRTLRQTLCASVARAQRRQRGLGQAAGARGGRGAGGSSSSGEGSSSNEGDSGTQAEDGGCSDGSSSGGGGARRASSASGDDGSRGAGDGGAGGRAGGRGPPGTPLLRGTASTAPPGPGPASGSSPMELRPGGRPRSAAARVCGFCQRPSRGGAGRARGDMVGVVAGGAAAGAEAAPGGADGAGAGGGAAVGPGGSSNTPDAAPGTTRKATAAGDDAGDGDDAPGGGPGPEAAAASSTRGVQQAAAGSGAAVMTSPRGPTAEPLPGPPGVSSGSGGTKLRRCGGCLRAWYCSGECQRRDWPRHAPECRERRNAAAEGPGGEGGERP